MRRLSRLFPFLVLFAVPALADNTFDVRGRQISGTVSGTGTAMAANSVCLQAQTLAEVGVSVAGTFVATLSFQGSVDGLSFFAVSATPQVPGAAVSSTTATGRWFAPVSGLGYFCVTGTAYTSGSATVTLNGSPAPLHLLNLGSVTSSQTLFSGTSPASATTVAQTAVTGLDGFNKAVVMARLLGATGGTLDVYIQCSVNGGTNYTDVVHFPQLAAAASAVAYVVTLSRGAQPGTAPVVVNTADGTPVLAANTVVPGGLGNACRVVTVAGAGTSAGAAQTIAALLSTN